MNSLFGHGAQRLQTSDLPPDASAVLVPVSYFVAWNGVIALVYEGFPPGLVGVKAALATLPAAPEKFGSKWPKTTLAALRDEAPLTLEQLQQLKDVCAQHAAALPAAVPLDSVSVIDYEQRGLERVVREHRELLQPPAAVGSSAPHDGRASAAEQERVRGVLSEWDDAAAYLPKVNAPGARLASYREESPSGCTCVCYLPHHADLLECLARFRAAIDEALPGRYGWLDDHSLHCTLRALDPAPDAAAAGDAEAAAALPPPPPFAPATLNGSSADGGARDLLPISGAGGGGGDVDGCAVRYYPSALGGGAADALLAALHQPSQLPWRTETDAFGPQARQTAYCADPSCTFAYVGLRLGPAPWPAALLHARAAAARSLGMRNTALLSGCLANHYAPGAGHIPWHYDEVRAHGAPRLVAALSLGGPRLFGLRPRGDGGDGGDGAGNGAGDGGGAANEQHIQHIELAHGSLLAMWGGTQQAFEHALPLRGDTDARRISLTFRSIVPGHEESLGGEADDPCVGAS